MALPARRLVLAALVPMTLVASSLAAPAAQAAPVSDPDAYSFLSRGLDPTAPVSRWDPCGGAITYRVNPARAPRHGVSDAKGAFARVAQATGLRLRYRGTTSAVPGADGKAGAYPPRTDIVVAWVTPGKQSPGYLPKPPKGYRGLAGVGGGTWWGAFTKSGAAANEITTGYVVLDATQHLASGFGAGPRQGPQGTEGQLLMHEIGHAVGLGHPAVDDPTEIMHPVMTHKKAVWGAGDLNGLRRVGATQGCLFSADPTRPAPARAGG